MGTDFLTQAWVWFGVGLTALILGLVGVLLAVIGWFQARSVRASQNWSTVQGEILEMKVEQYRYSGSEGTSTAYRPRVIYGYRVGGRDYVSERLNFGSGFHSSIRGLAENKAKQFATGSRVQVYYDPKDPNEATLERTSPSSRVLYILAGVFVLSSVAACGAGFFLI